MRLRGMAQVTPNPWLTTISGKQVHLLNPSTDEITVEDIAWSLGGIRRYLNHTTHPWTVAEHSIVVAMICRELGHHVNVQLSALFHDATEAYIGDIPSPVKWAMDAEPNVHGAGSAALREVERRVDEAICAKFRLIDHNTLAVIKEADLIARATEARDYLPVAILEVEPRQNPLPYHIEACLAYALFLFTGSCQDIDRKPADLFLDVYESLTRQRGGLEQSKIILNDPPFAPRPRPGTQG
jgi:hypothetical protein